MAACGSQETLSGSPKTENKAQKIACNNAAAPESLDRHKITGIPEIHIRRDLSEGLVQPDGNGQVQPAVAEKWGSTDNSAGRCRISPFAAKPVHKATVEQYGAQWTRDHVGNGAFALQRMAS